MAAERRHRAASAAVLLVAAAVLAPATAVVVGFPQPPWAPLSGAAGRPALVTVLTALAGWAIVAALVAGAMRLALSSQIDRQRREPRTTRWAALVCLLGLLILALSVVHVTVGYRVCCGPNTGSGQAVTSGP